MDFHSVSEIFDHIDRTRGRLLRAVEGLSEGQQHFRPAPERWSVAQLCEHLASVEENVTGLVRRLLAKAEESGAPARAGGAPFDPVNIEGFVESTRGVKIEAPERLRPADATPLADSLARLAGARATLHALRPGIERADGRAIRFPHPACGTLDLYQWVLFVGAHEDRHLAQIETLKEAMNAEGRSAD